jgi:hypothetical protein
MTMRRRQFITLLGGTAVWPLAAGAQQAAMPVIGYLSSLGQNDGPDLLDAFRRGLGEAGYVEGRNVAIEYRFAEDQPDRLPALAADRMTRRDFVTLLGGAASWPLAARGQPANGMRRIGVLVPGDEDDRVYKPRVSAFTQALADLGWIDGRNVRMDLRWHGDDINQARAFAQELVGLPPDIIVTGGVPATLAVQRETRTIPIVFANVGDPVASGIVARLDHPNGNITGFANLEASLAGKWLELLSEIAPGLKRAAIMFNSNGAREPAFTPI